MPNDIQKLLQNDLQLCRECTKLILQPNFTVLLESSQTSSLSCRMCFGMHTDAFIDKALSELEKSVTIYGGIHENLFSGDAPTLAIPISCYFRVAAVKSYIQLNLETGVSVHESVSDIVNKMKDGIRKRLRMSLHEKQRSESYPFFHDLDDDSLKEIKKEEAGFMNSHIIVHSTEKISFPTNAIELPEPSFKRERKRFRGNAPSDLQGGCPRSNLDARIKADITKRLKDSKNGNEIQNFKVLLLDRSPLTQDIDSLCKKEHVKQKLADWIKSEACFLGESNNDLITMHVASWRKPFYLKGRYTKCKRNVSQTPFYVPLKEGEKSISKGCKMKKLGITSVEEEICPLVAKICCRGISVANNRTPDENSIMNTVFGMVKFHASGREDMDVRMVLPLNVLDQERVIHHEKKSEFAHASGRPFCLEIIDALRVPTRESLLEAMLAINCVTSRDDIVCIGSCDEYNGWIDEKERKFVQYGQNINGVGISSLIITGSTSFSGLQAETEDKVKFYGCLCWCKNPIPSQEQLNYKLCGDGSIFPMEIKQSTPLRVLHRRSAAIRVRHILSLEAKRISDHWFRLSLSTSAGTYVKEFCHGDCGRTSPSVSSLLGCTVDIVELDCEGIAT